MTELAIGSNYISNEMMLIHFNFNAV